VVVSVANLVTEATSSNYH